MVMLRQSPIFDKVEQADLLTTSVIAKRAMILQVDFHLVLLYNSD